LLLLSMETSTDMAALPTVDWQVAVRVALGTHTSSHAVPLGLLLCLHFLARHPLAHLELLLLLAPLHVQRCHGYRTRAFFGHKLLVLLTHCSSQKSRVCL